jgi:tetratricopeptide (TPR) repeat protein
MRRGLLTASLAAVLAVSASCGPKPVVMPTAGVLQYPDFVEPKAPPSMDRTPAAGAQARAWQFLQGGDLRNAEREASAALRTAPDFFPAATTLAYVDLARRNPRDAVTKFDRALSRDAAYAPALAGKGHALAALNRDNEAVAAFEAALAADASLTDVGRRLDVVRLRLSQRSITSARQAAAAGRFEEAIARYRSALERSPDSAFLYRELALAERDHGSGDDAVEHFRKATILDPGDAASLVDLAGMLDARNEFDAALEAYGDALAIDPDPAVTAKRDALSLRADIARLPPEYRAIEAAVQISRGDLAALIGVRLQRLVAAARPRDVGVMTDIRGYWAEPWILQVARAGAMNPFENHTFQPRSVVRRVDLAQAATRLLAQIAAAAPAEGRRWQNARGRFPDLTTTHVAYPAASTAIAAGVMLAADDGAFQPSRPVSGAEATDAIVRILALSGSGVRRP